MKVIASTSLAYPLNIAANFTSKSFYLSDRIEAFNIFFISILLFTTNVYRWTFWKTLWAPTFYAGPLEF